MRITDQQLDKFICMVRDFAKKHALTLEIDTTGVPVSSSKVFLSNGYKWNRYEVLWNETKSLTDACTTIFAHAINLFNLNGDVTCVDQFDIKDVIFNDPATIVLWADGTKTVVKCQEGDEYSEELGLAMCFAKKALGNKSSFNNVFHQWVPEKEEESVVIGVDPLSIKMRAIGENAKQSSNILDEIRKILNRPLTQGEEGGK